MITTFKITIEHIIIAILAILLLFKSCGSRSDCNPVATVTTVEETVITKKDSVSIPGIQNRQAEIVNVIETPSSVKRITDTKNLTEVERGQIKSVYRYQDTTRLKGSIIFSDILSEGKILDFNLKTEIDHTIKTLTTKETLVKTTGGYFISPGINYSPALGINGVETSITYIKGSFGVSAGGFYNFGFNPAPGTIGFQLKLHIKL